MTREQFDTARATSQRLIKAYPAILDRMNADLATRAYVLAREIQCHVLGEPRFDGVPVHVTVNDEIDVELQVLLDKAERIH